MAGSNPVELSSFLNEQTTDGMIGHFRLRCRSSGSRCVCFFSMSVQIRIRVEPGARKNNKTRIQAPVIPLPTPVYCDVLPDSYTEII